MLDEKTKRIAKITPKELECIMLLTKGANNKQIARQLDISYSIVQTRLKNIRKKLGCNNRHDVIKFIRKSL